MGLPAATIDGPPVWDTRAGQTALSWPARPWPMRGVSVECCWNGPHPRKPNITPPPVRPVHSPAHPELLDARRGPLRTILSRCVPRVPEVAPRPRRERSNLAQGAATAVPEQIAWFSSRAEPNTCWPPGRSGSVQGRPRRQVRPTGADEPTGHRRARPNKTSNAGCGLPGRMRTPRPTAPCGPGCSGVDFVGKQY